MQVAIGCASVVSVAMWSDPVPPAAGRTRRVRQDRDVPAASEPPLPRVVATDELAALDAVATAAAVAAGEVAAGEVVAAALARAEALDPVLRSLASVDPEVALARAGVAAGPLAGVPTAIKDLYELAGAPTTFGSRAAGGHVSCRTAPAVAELLALGLVPIGKSAASEYGMTPTTEPLGFPPTRNPWDPARSAGGSSGGAAAAVAARIVPVAHATDGGGSTRIPAALCGLVGLKTTDGRLVDLPGNRQMPVRLLSSGVVSRTVRDTAAVLEAAEARRPAGRLLPVARRPGAGPPPRVRVGVVRTSPVAEVAPDVQAAVARTAEDLAALGHHVEDAVLPVDHLRLADDFVLYWGLLAASLPTLGRLEVGRRFDRRLLDPWTRGLARHARRRWAELPAAVARLRRLRGAYAAATPPDRVWLSPTTGCTAPPLGWLDVTLPFEAHRARATALTPFAALWNVAGAPAVSLPTALSAGGLPVGVQLGGPHGAERLLLDLAAELEQAPGFLRPLGPGPA
jgi:amidase